MDDLVVLNVGGGGYHGWENISIVRSIESVAGAFELSLSDLGSEDGQAARTLALGGPCTVTVAGETVITGYVDSIEPEYDKALHRISVKGRDKTADLVDCSALNSPGQWEQRTLTQIAEDIAKPFGISVRARVFTGEPYEFFTLQRGETAFEAIERGCRRAACLAVSDGLGGLMLTRAGVDGGQAAVVLGENVLKARGHFSVKERFHRYIVLSQSPGNDFVDPKENAEAIGEAFDSGVRKERALIVFAEESEISVDLGERAVWEATTRYGRGRRVEVTVQGWRDGAGTLWSPNRMVRYRDPLMGIDEDMLIVSVALSLSDGGSTTTLTVADPKGFELLPVGGDE